jgi:hypothetical protein
MAIYKVEAPNKCIYTMEGPAGATEDQVFAEVIRQFPHASIPASSKPSKCTLTGPEYPTINAVVSIARNDSVFDKIDLYKAGGEAFTSTVGFGLLGLLFFWVIARQLVRIPRATPNQLGIWCGAALAGLSIMVTGGSVLHLGWQEVLYRVLLLIPVYFIIGYALGYGFRKIKLANPPNANKRGDVRSEHSETSMIDNDFYLKAMAELDHGQQDKGLWARCFAEADGDDSKAKAAYIRRRVEILAK